MKRAPFYFDQSRTRTDEGPLFSWFHSDAAVPQADCVAVICAPIGHEYTRSHRTIRHLADQLAAKGIPALRFDAHGTGNSPGDELDLDRLGHWQAGIRAAIRQAKALSGRERVCLIGVRLGAMLAALVASETPVDYLVLWNPSLKGRTYVRELQAIAMSAQRDTSSSERGLESAGFTMAPQTLEALRAVDLTKRRYQVTRRALLVGRDDLAPDTAIVDHLAAQGVPCDTVRVPGWLGMMADHQFTVVPEEALATIAGWVASHAGSSAAPPARQKALPSVNAFVHETLEGHTVEVEEELAQFGADRHLFGVLSRPLEKTDQPVVLMANAGAIHHVGPNRLYVTLARELASMGIPSLRLDLESLGDSVLRGAGRENYPYPDNAIDDVRAAIRWLAARGYSRFVVLGLCSGAHTAYHAGLEIEDATIDEVVLVNPWEFYWVEGMSLDTNRLYEDVAGYKKSMKDPKRWLKVLRGEVDLVRAAKVGASHAWEVLRTRAKHVAEILHLTKDTRLTRDLKRLLKTRHLSMFISEGDPGRELLMRDAKRTATRALRDGRIELQMIPDADHTFSQWRSRRDVLGRLLGHFARRYGAQPATSRESPSAARRAA
jgi:alpha-beta hydrolase superfamily lysophospholipase